MKFKIYYVSGIGGDQIDMLGGPQEIEDFKSEKEAEEYAWRRACEEYYQYTGSTVRDVEDIMDEEDCDEKEAKEIFIEERENSIDYKVVPVADDNVEKMKKDIKRKG